MEVQQTMSRLADYFLVVGYDHEKDRSGKSGGYILQRFPEKDWDDCPFTMGIEMFCQPSGWQLSKVKQPPTYFVSVLTDIDANRHYCACLTFHEPVSLSPSNHDDEDGDEEESDIVPHSQLYAPKSLALVSRLKYLDTFRTCLGLFYTVYIENMQVQLETLVGNILGCIQVPPPGGPQVRFSIGAGDRQALQPPLWSTVPTTQTSVAKLFQQLGINISLSVFCAALADHKVLFHSQSYSRITEACMAISSLMYPLKYSYVYIPLLPSGLAEVLSTPTPFIAGVHTSLEAEFSELLDVIIVDLDGGSIRIPEHVQLALMPDALYRDMVQALQMILNPDLLIADQAFPSSPAKKPMLDMLDKEIRAVFLRFFSQLFFGYRSCLTIIRIHPEPVITFHKANFLGHRSLVEDDFTTRVLDSMSFTTFVAERGSPYRVCDVFDEVYASMPEMLKEEENKPQKMLMNIRELAQQLYTNENPSQQPYVQKIPKPTEGAYDRIHLPTFPVIDWVVVQDIIQDGMAKQALKAKLANVRPVQPRIVPMGPHISCSRNRGSLIYTNARRLEVLRNCVTYIFENKISDAKKILPAVQRALKGKVARLALVDELELHVQSNRSMLEQQQFELVVKLLNCALQNDSNMDENGVAAAILPLATAFCRKLCTGVIQFAYTCVQEHAVWSNLQFWEATFYQDVQQEIQKLYLPRYKHLMPEPESISRSSQRETKDLGGGDNLRRTPEIQRRSASTTATKQLSALEIAAEQLRIWPNQSSSEKEEMISNEESTVYSQAIHYANRMVYMRVPLDATKGIQEPGLVLEGESTSSNITNSVAESDSLDNESGFDEQEVPETGASVVKFVTKFIDKVCTESSVLPDHIKSLHTMIPGVVAMHLETLDAVFKESKRLPPIPKPKILTPTLLPGEEIVMDGLRVYLIPDGREEGTGGYLGGPSLLPAEGGICLTTYRIIFKGTPCDPYACEQIVCRSFPVSSLTREKKIGITYTQNIDQHLQEGLQLRSNTFQLMKIAFDEEVSAEDIETLRKLMNKIRSPTSVLTTFTFSSHFALPPSQLHKHKEKNASLKGFAKRTLMKTARKAGFMTKETTRKQKYIMPTPPPQRRQISTDFDRDRPAAVSFDDQLAVIEETEITHIMQADARNPDRLAERLYCQDYSRLCLGSLLGNPNKGRYNPFRLTLVNCTYSLCRSYPAVLVVPHSVTDDSIRKFARSHRQYRFPVVTWRHRTTKAVLLRASGFLAKGVMGMLKGHHHNVATGTPRASTGETSTSLEQEKYFSAIVQSTPMGNQRLSHSPSDSLTSLDSLMLSAASAGELGFKSCTPETPRRNPIARAVTNIRTSGGKTKWSSVSKSRYRRLLVRSPNKNKVIALGRIGSNREKRISTASLQFSLPGQARHNGTVDVADIGEISVQGLHKAALYVFGDKTQIKGIKMDSFPKCDFIPVDFQEVRHVKTSFKKLMRACVPSSPYSDPDHGMLKGIEESEWMTQLQNILQLSGAIVDLLDVQGSSVMLCLEDGWDFTTQVISIAQLCLDPHYRTIQGFRTLVEKEWHAFGHRFTHRSNQTAANQPSGFAPIFLQFLDVVHQVHLQFPMSFEFNQYFLKFLAYHHVSNRFRTFMLDNECERVEAGWMYEERPRSGTLKAEGSLDTDATLSYRQSSGCSMWDYIDQHVEKSSVFYNFHYAPNDHDPTQQVLRPYSNISNLKVWDYYIKENLAYGPSYDFEIVSKETKIEEEEEVLEPPLGSPWRRVINGCYDDVGRIEPDSCVHLIQEINRIEAELFLETTRWQDLWKKLEKPSEDLLQRQGSLKTALVRSYGRTIHKRSTIELLVKGKMLGADAARMFSQPHHFEKFTYTTPTYCDVCSQLLWGLVKQGMRCTECSFNCHEKCMQVVPKNCAKLRAVSDTSSVANVSLRSFADSSSTSGVGTLRDSQLYDQFSSTVTEHRTHEGYLYKKGALLKGWKQRWFVLDSVKHQLRYYDDKDDTHCKGFVDLSEVSELYPLKNERDLPKKANKNAVFEMKTTQRVYNFLAPDSAAAQEWIEKIQSSIQ